VTAISPADLAKKKARTDAAKNMGGKNRGSVAATGARKKLGGGLRAAAMANQLAAGMASKSSNGEASVAAGRAGSRECSVNEGGPVGEISSTGGAGAAEALQQVLAKLEELASGQRQLQEQHRALQEQLSTISRRLDEDAQASEAAPATPAPQRHSGFIWA
jgi:hypothetical protein